MADSTLLKLRKKYITNKRRVMALRTGSIILIIFLITTLMLALFALFGMLGMISGVDGPKDAPVFWIIYCIVAVFAEATLFWIGIGTVYVSSIQLGVRVRVLGIIFGWIPVLNLIMLGIIIVISMKEVVYEGRIIKKDDLRKQDHVCQTKYPLLLVHGVFFRDTEIFNYWGRVPEELEYNGATIYYGEHNSAAAVDNSAKELAIRIKEILKESGAEKLNVIAHSKGGLDMRTAIAKEGMGPYIASLTTINTPHRGCEFAEYLLGEIPQNRQESIAHFYNVGAGKLGDKNPDFLAAVYDLTAESCRKRNEEVLDDPSVYYQSYGSRLNNSRAGRFPVNMSYGLVKRFDGPNDGLVGEKSFEWGSKYTYLTTKGKRGISHADVIDLNRDNFDGFDVREFYIGVVSDLKNKGF